MAPAHDALRVISEILSGEAQKATPDPSERYTAIIRQMFGTTQKAAPVNPAIRAIAQKHGVSPLAMVEALRELAKGGSNG